MENTPTNEPLCSLELSKAFKEAGFDWPCYDYIIESTANTRYSSFNKGNTSYIDNYLSDRDILRPTLFQAQLWLIEQGVECVALPVFRDKCSYDSWKRVGYTYNILVIEECQLLMWSDFNQSIENIEDEKADQYAQDRCLTDCYDTMPEALAAGLPEAVKLIKG